jgi:hypothetical protein
VAQFVGPEFSSARKKEGRREGGREEGRKERKMLARIQERGYPYTLLGM